MVPHTVGAGQPQRAGKPIGYFGGTAELAGQELENQFGSHLEKLSRSDLLALLALIISRSYYWEQGRFDLNCTSLSFDNYEALSEDGYDAVKIANNLSQSGAMAIAAFLIDTLRYSHHGRNRNSGN